MWRPAAPARISSLNRGFCLPFCHSSSRKASDDVKATSRSRKALQTGLQAEELSSLKASGRAGAVYPGLDGGDGEQEELDEDVALITSEDDASGDQFADEGVAAQKDGADAITGSIDNGDKGDAADVFESVDAWARQDDDGGDGDIGTVGGANGGLAGELAAGGDEVMDAEAAGLDGEAEDTSLRSSARAWVGFARGRKKAASEGTRDRGSLLAIRGFGRG
eukprot:SM000164S02276  [mRNA]  locus=s164:254193:255471:- [translate_table: standard]